MYVFVNKHKLIELLFGLIKKFSLCIGSLFDSLLHNEYSVLMKKSQQENTPFLFFQAFQTKSSQLMNSGKNILEKLTSEQQQLPELQQFSLSLKEIWLNLI